MISAIGVLAVRSDGCDNYCMWRKRIKAAWALYRHLAALKGLLDALGLWKLVVVPWGVAMALLATHWKSLPPYQQFLVFLAGSARSAFLAGFIIYLVRVIQDEKVQAKNSSLGASEKPKLLVTPSLLSFPLSPSIMGIGPLRSAPTRPLSEDECCASWSGTISSSKELWLTISNNTPNSSYCTVKIVSIQRWSEKQKQFIDTRPRSIVFAFDVYKGAVVPERTNPSVKLIESSRKDFKILGLERGRTLSESVRGRWKLGLLIRLGERERRQELCFKWTKTSGLSQCQCSADAPWDWTALPLTPQASSDIFGTDEQSPESTAHENPAQVPPPE